MKEIAITAMSGIFPGANNINDYWDNILNCRVAPLETMDKRWGVPREKYFSPEPGNPNRIYMDQAFTLTGPFSVNHGSEEWGRQVEVGKHVLQQLIQNCSPGLETSSTGLVVGTEWSDQGYLNQDINCFFKEAGAQSPDIFSPSSVYSPEKQVREIARAAKLGGPRLSVDNACASSLYALDAGIKMLQSEQCSSVAVLGLNALLPEFIFLGFSRLLAFSREGSILPFSADASGLVLGEAAGAVLLEPLSRARQANRPLLGVIRSLGLSADGLERSIFAPGTEGQRLALKRAYRELDPSQLDYLEAHGTATVVGDETELKVMEEFFGPYLNKNGQQVPLGTSKSLIGHTLAAAGMVSLLKALMILNQGIIPPYLPVKENSYLPETSFYLPREQEAVEPENRPARIGISAFGFGGSNAHLVLESFQHQAEGNQIFPVGSSDTEGDHYRFTPLAIVDLETAFGNSLDALTWKETIKAEKSQKNNMPLPLERLNSFPRERFNLDPGELLSADNVYGFFLPSRFTIDASGLRMGANLLQRVDAFQLLFTHLVQLLAGRNEEIKESEQTAVIFCNNLGGSMPMQISRKLFSLFHCGSGRDYSTPRVSFEEIASSLPNMLSGFPALHFNLRGFHQLLSGESGIFWSSLMQAPLVLQESCKNLLLGAGTLVKSPVDLWLREKEFQQDNQLLYPPGEGAAVYLLKTHEQALRDQNKILAVITGIIPGWKADTWEKACSAAGISPSSIDTRETSQLERYWPGIQDDTTTANYGGSPGMEEYGMEAGRQQTQELTGFLEEAAGIEALSRVLLDEGQKAAIEVKSGSRLVMTVFLDKKSSHACRPGKPDMPLEINMSQDYSVEEETTVTEENPEIIKAAGADKYMQEDTSFKESQDYPGPSGQANDKDPDDFSQELSGESQLSSGFEAASTGHGNQEDNGEEADELEHFLAWQDSAASLLHSYLEHQRRIALILYGVDLNNRLAELKRSPLHTVLQSAHFDRRSKTYQAEIVVNENHPYFFDHPLDHVPGILLLEAIVQLIELAMPDRLTELEIQKCYFKAVEIYFHRFCEKNHASTVQLSQEESKTGQAVYRGKIISQNQVICEAGFTVALDSGEGYHAPPSSVIPPALPEKKLVHKHREENILTHQMETPEPGIYRCRLIKPPAGHLLAEGQEKYYPPVYLLETTRQFLMQIAHRAMDIPTQTPMNLLSFKTSLRIPARRLANLHLLWNEEQPVKTGNMVLANVKTSIYDDNNYLGESSIMAQAVDPETYRSQRNL